MSSALSVWGLVTISLISMPIFSGAIFGIGAGLNMLRDEGQYRDKCDNSAGIETKCESQDSSLAVIPTISLSLFTIGIVVGGIVVDRFGRIPLIISGFILALTGQLLVAFSNSNGTDAFIPGFSLIACGGGLLMIASYTVPGLAKPKYRAAIMTGMNSLGDLGFVISAFPLFESFSFPLLSFLSESCQYALNCLGPARSSTSSSDR